MLPSQSHQPLSLASPIALPLPSLRVLPILWPISMMTASDPGVGRPPADSPPSNCPPRFPTALQVHGAEHAEREGRV